MSEGDYSFGLIMEGRSDHAVVKQILRSFFGDYELPVKPILPALDETDNSLSRLPIGWGNVRAHLQNEDDFLSNFEASNFVVVQIDSDRSNEFGVPHSHPIEAREKTVEELVSDVRDKLIEWIGEDNYAEVKDRVIFAVAVHEIECWLLPIYFSTEKSKHRKITGCTSTLNTVLEQEEGFYINEKDYFHYEKMAKHYKKRKDLLRLGHLNPSLSSFLTSLERLLPANG